MPMRSFTGSKLRKRRSRLAKAAVKRAAGSHSSGLTSPSAATSSPMRMFRCTQARTTPPERLFEARAGAEGRPATPPGPPPRPQSPRHDVTIARPADRRKLGRSALLEVLRHLLLGERRRPVLLLPGGRAGGEHLGE